jgi:hypothetical protein
VTKFNRAWQDTIGMTYLAASIIVLLPDVSDLFVILRRQIERFFAANANGCATPHRRRLLVMRERDQ